ncbi:hypothetical protein D3C80_1727240 [compost metagenome]
MTVHGCGQFGVGGLNSGYVGAGGKGADLETAVPVMEEQLFQGSRVDVAVRSGRHCNDITDSLLPGQQVGMMLHMADEDDRAFLRRTMEALALPLGQLQAHQPLQLVDRAGCAVAAE